MKMEKEKKEVKSEEDVLLRGANGERGALNVRGVLMGASHSSPFRALSCPDCLSPNNTDHESLLTQSRQRRRAPNVSVHQAQGPSQGAKLEEIEKRGLIEPTVMND